MPNPVPPETTFLGRKSLHVKLTPVVIDIVDMPLTINSQHPSKPNNSHQGRETLTKLSISPHAIP